MNIIVARKLHERRFRPNPVMTTGELLNLIGSDGMQEALQNRWIVPDQDTGFLTLNINGGKMVELESACRCGTCGKTDCTCVAEAGPKLLSAMPAPMREAFAGFGIASPGAPTSSTQPAATTPDPSPTEQVSPGQRQYRSGDPVMIEQDNVTYRGEISGFEPDGRVRLRWRGQRPPNDRAYGPGEFLVTSEKPGTNA